MQKDYVSGQGNVRTLNIDSATKDVIEVHSHQFIGRPKQGLLDYRGDVKGKIQRSRVYEPGITFEAQHLIGYRDQSRMELRENVKVVRLGVIATSRNGEIFMENYNKKLKYFVLSDDVKVWEKVVNLDGTSFVREAFGDKLEGLTSEGKLILTGLPKVIQQGDTIRGNRIIIKENNQVVEVDDSNTNFIIR
jgi:lipopolysaccharide export system protein LptA